MRALAAAVALALLTGGCAVPRLATHEQGGETGYNRRELDEPRQGLFTGSDGEWTVYRNDAPKRPPPQPAASDVPRERSTLLCSPRSACDPPAEAP